MTQSVSGEQATTECTQITHELADYVMTHRREVRNLADALFEECANYKLFLTGFPEIQVMNGLAQTYADPSKLYKFLADNGIPGVTDWSWLPTKNLMVQHGDRNLCMYYRNGDYKDELPTSTIRMFSGHETALERLYEASWNSAANQGQGLCTMYSYAALEYISKPVLSSDTQQVLESGEDSSVFDDQP